MPKLNLIIADEDEAYAENLLAYLSENYRDRFNTMVFTKPELFREFTDSVKSKTDILLITHEMAEKQALQQDSLLLKGNPIIIYLESSFIEENNGLTGHVEKYRQADLIAGDITQIYAQLSKNNLDIIRNKRDTKAFAVFSPSGGTGKTSIAIGLSILAAKRGLSVFYLNLEYLQSTPLYLNGVNAYNMSSVIYHIRQKSSNLPVRLEASVCNDSEYGINYFQQPDSSRDIEEFTIEEFDVLLNKLKASAKFDLVIIDMTDSLDKRNLHIIENSDSTAFIASPDTISQTKLMKLADELERKDMELDSPVTDNRHFVLNKHISGICDGGKTEGTKAPSFKYKVPFIEGTDFSRELPGLISSDNEYTRSIKALLDGMLGLRQSGAEQF